MKNSKETKKIIKDGYKKIAIEGSGCVAGALLKNDYLNKIKKTGFNIHILSENKEISKQQYHGIALESLMVELIK